LASRARSGPRHSAGSLAVAWAGPEPWKATIKSRPRMDSDKDYREIFRAAGARWLEGDPAALSDFELGITKALEAGDMTATLSPHPRLSLREPADTRPQPRGGAPRAR